MRTQVDKDDSVATILTNLISVYTALLDLLHKDQVEERHKCKG